MNALTAKLVCEDFWVVCKGPAKVGNIRQYSDRVEFKQGAKIHKFQNLSELSEQLRMEFQQNPTIVESKPEVLGYVAHTWPYNAEFDLSKKIPLYTATAKSRSKRCAGYYLVQDLDETWAMIKCPKLITIRRYPFRGPFRTFEEVEKAKIDLESQ